MKHNLLPLVSVMIACRNSGQDLAETLASVGRQDYAGIETVVTGYGSGENNVSSLLADSANAGPDTRFICESHPTAAAARNHAARLAKGRYFLFLDEGDILMPGYVAECVAVLENRPNCKLVYSETEYPDSESESRQPAIPLTAMHRAADFAALNGFDEKSTEGGVGDYWLRLLAAGGETVRLPEALIRRKKTVFVFDGRNNRGSEALPENEQPQQNRLFQLEQAYIRLHETNTELTCRLSQWERYHKKTQTLYTVQAAKPFIKIEQAISAANSYRKAFRFLTREHGGAGKTYKILKKSYQEHGWKGVRQVLQHVFSEQQALCHTKIDDRSYANWIECYDKLTPDETRLMKQAVSAMKNRPLISLVMPVYNPPVKMLEQAIQSVRRQIYPDWELCIADDASTDPEVRKILERHAGEDARIKVVYRRENGHISAASNSAVGLATGEFIALFDNDDLLPEHALFWVARAIVENPHVDLIYSDEDKIDEENNRLNPYFKPDWNQDLFYAHNLITHLGVYRASIVRELGGFRLGFEGAQDYDLALRFVEIVPHENILHIPRILYHWRIHALSTAGGAEAKPYAMIAGERALNEHFERMGFNGSVKLLEASYRARYRLPEKQPKVSVIIPTRNGFKLVKQCIESIFNLTTYKNFEVVLVDNGSDDDAALRYFDEIKEKYPVTVLRDDSPFNYSALNNRAAEIADGEFLCLLNNDIEVITPEWLGEMVSHILRPGVGIVGAKLLYPDNTIQHAGVIVGMGGSAGHIFCRQPNGFPGYAGRANFISNFSAVTAACLLVSKEIYRRVGGLDEENLKIAYNDIDFCLKVIQQGYRIVYTPYAELYHYESASRGYENTPEKEERFKQEYRYFQSKWKEIIRHDPAYNPNLTVEPGAYGLAWPPRLPSVEQILKSEQA